MAYVREYDRFDYNPEAVHTHGLAELVEKITTAPRDEDTAGAADGSQTAVSEHVNTAPLMMVHPEQLRPWTDAANGRVERPAPDGWLSLRTLKLVSAYVVLLLGGMGGGVLSVAMIWAPVVGGVWLLVRVAGSRLARAHQD